MSSRKLPVKFVGDMLETWQEIYPDLPPGDEMVLMMQVDPCIHCGAEINEESRIGGLDPVKIVDGVIYGDHVCFDCMEKGL